MEIENLRVIVHGRVQGVGFRDFASRKARELGLSGFTRNLPSGQVEVEVEGTREDLNSFLEFLKKGPPGAAIQNIDVRWNPPPGKYADFEILYYASKPTRATLIKSASSSWGSGT